MGRVQILMLCCVGACSSATTSNGGTPILSDQLAFDCRPVDTSAAPEITHFEDGGLTIHTFVAPAVSAHTATHVIESDEGLVIVDTQMLREYARQFRRYVDGLGKPITHVIVSHGHPDHYFGLEFFEDRPTYALPETRLDMRQRHRFHLQMHRETEAECDAVTDRVRFVAHDLATGAQTFAGVPMVIERQSDAEDNDQAVIRIPGARTLVLQDLMATNAHAFTSAGMIDPWIERLRLYGSESEYTHVLAGHGSPTDLAGIAEMIDYLEKCQRILGTARTADEFITAMQSTFPERRGTYLVELMAKLKFDGEQPSQKSDADR